MGFEAKLEFVTAEKWEAEQVGTQGETHSTVWRDYTQFEMNFGRITRLEKLISPEYAHITHASFPKAGIMVFGTLLKRWQESVTSKPVRNSIFPHIVDEGAWKDVPSSQESAEEDWKRVFQGMGGRDYAKVYFPFELAKWDLKKTEALRAKHNRAVADLCTLSEEEGRRKLDEGINLCEPPFLWFSCFDAACWLKEAQEKDAPAWRAVKDDPLTVAVILGWQAQLDRLGAVDVRAVMLIP